MQSGFGKTGHPGLEKMSVRGSAAMHSRYATVQAWFARLCFPERCRSPSLGQQRTAAREQP